MNLKLSALNVIEAEYKQFRLHNQLQQAQFLLSVNWTEINSERTEVGLPKISNDTTRKAYLREKFFKDNEKELSLELRYNTALREYQDEFHRKLSEDNNKEKRA